MEPISIKHREGLSHVFGCIFGPIGKINDIELPLRMWIDSDLNDPQYKENRKNLDKLSLEDREKWREASRFLDGKDPPPLRYQLVRH